VRVHRLRVEGRGDAQRRGGRRRVLCVGRALQVQAQGQDEGQAEDQADAHEAREGAKVMLNGFGKPEDIAAARGFAARQSVLQIYGTCEQCRSGKSPRPEPSTSEMVFARDAIRILSWLKTNAAHAHPMIIVNKAQPSFADISKADFEASIERKVDFVIPYDIKAASNAAKLGQVFVDANRSSKATAAIRQVAERVIGANPDDLSAGSGEEKKSLLGGFDFKALLAKKAKPEPETADE
jgi:hypothetical protein